MLGCIVSEHWLSPTQIQLWMDCNRKWSFQYQDGIRGDGSNAQALGTETHRQLEMYYDHNEPFLFSSADPIEQHAAELAQAGLEYLPERAPHLETEREFLLISPKHKYYGLIDLVDDKTGTVYDHKTTSNLKYMKDEEALRVNVQAIIYATHAMVEWQRPEVNLQWTYMRTKGKTMAVPTFVKLTEGWVGPMFAIVEDVADEIEAARGKPTLDLPPNPNMCFAYGGCPYQNLCHLGPKERLRATMSSNDTQDLLARLTRGKPDSEVVVPLSQALSPTTTVAPGQINPPEAAQAPEPPPDAPKGDVAPAKAKKYTRKDKSEVTITEKAPDAPALPAKEYHINNLCLGCVPTGNGVPVNAAAFSGLVQAANQMIRDTEFKNEKGEAFRVQDYRDIPFGRGAGVLLAAVQQVLSQGTLDCLVVESMSTPEISVCLNFLIDTSKVIIRAVR